MDAHSSHTGNELPWPLIVAALQGELTSGDQLQLEAWLMASPANQQQFERLERVWKEGVADYPRYSEADETRAWSDMQARLDPGAAPRIGRWRWMAAAAVLVVLIGAAELWQRARTGGGMQYATTDRAEVLSLADETKVVIEPRSRIQVVGGYNKTTRTVILLDGQASFAVTPHQDIPFEVVMDGASVRDIGTSFIVYKTADSIGVEVTQGKVLFTDKVTGETREMAAGSSVVQLMSPDRRGEIKFNDLRFNNARLSDVIAAVEERYGKKIGLEDPALGKKRLTVHLDGESFDDAVKVICASLNLESQADSNGYFLKNRVTR